MKGCFVPSGIDGLMGATAIETRAAGVTTKVVAPWIEFKVALMVAVPLPTAVAEPCVPESLLMLAVEGVSEFH